MPKHYTVTKSPLMPVGNTPAIPLPWNLYNETDNELVSCHATYMEATRAKAVLVSSEYLDEQRRIADQTEFVQCVQKANKAYGL